MRLEQWMWDGDTETFSGTLFGHEIIGDGAQCKLKATYVDWAQGYFKIGAERVKLGRSFADKYYEGQEDWPWQD